MTATENYGLAAGVVTDDLIEPEHHNRLAEALDRVLGSFLRQMMADGAWSGWELATDGTVGAGEGLVGACWCKTAAALAVTGLTANAVNYVFGGTTEDSATAGSVRFYAELSATKAPGSVLLGAMTVDSDGKVAAVDDGVDGVDRNCLRLEIGTARGNGTVASVPVGESCTVNVSHGVSFAVPGAIAVDVPGEGFTTEVRNAHEAAGFVIVGTNTGTQAADFVYAWERRGLIG